MMDRAEHGHIALDGEQPVTEALVVVHEVELALACAQVVPRPQGEGERLRERTRREGGDLHEVRPVLELPDAGHAHREVVVVDVEAGQLDQRDPLVEDGKGLAAEHLDGVTEVDQRFGQVPGVDALAADMRFAPICHEGDAQWSVVRLVHGEQAFMHVDLAVKCGVRPGEAAAGALAQAAAWQHVRATRRGARSCRGRVSGTSARSCGRPRDCRVRRPQAGGSGHPGARTGAPRTGCPSARRRPRRTRSRTRS